MVPSRFNIWPTPAARARQHLLGDGGLAPYISRLVCRSFNVLYQCCFRRRKILESVRRLSEYLLAGLVDICHSTRNRIQWNDEALDDNDIIWRMCNWLIHQVTKRGCELWPRALLRVSRFISRARKEGCVIWFCQGMKLCLILWHVVMPPIARGYSWLYQRSPLSTVPNTGRNLSNSNYGGLDKEEEGMGCGKSFCLGGRHRTVDVMNWNVPQLFSNSKWNPHFISANITEERYHWRTIMPVSFAIISMRLGLYPCDRGPTTFAACNITRVSNSSWLHGLSGYSDTSAPDTWLPNTFGSRVDITSSFLHRIWSEQWLLADNVTIPPCCLRSADRFQFLGNCPFPSCRIRCLIPAPILSLVVAYKPSGRLPSHMTSTLLVLANYVSIYGITFLSV